MEDYIDWTEMVKYMQELKRFSRNVFCPRPVLTLGTAETEVLSCIFLNQPIAPQQLAHRMSVKKMNLSRVLKGLSEKQLIDKTHSVQDHRSYTVCLTEEGRMQLDLNCRSLLGSTYALRDKLGTERFLQLIKLIAIANQSSQEG